MAKTKQAIIELLNKVGAVQEGSSVFILNGFRIKVLNERVQWHKESILLGFGVPLSMYETVDKKDCTPIKNANLQVFEYIIDVLSKNKSKELAKLEKKAASKVAKERSQWHAKRDWCRECTLTEQKPHDELCAKMHLHNDLLYYCSDKEWWDSAYCRNAQRFCADETKPYVGYYTCKLTGSRCPFSTPSTFHREVEIMRGHKGCPHWKEGSLYKEKRA